MSVDLTKFAHSGIRWSDRARLGEFESVLYAGGSERVNLMMHGATLFAAKVALALSPEKRAKRGVLLDYGCGTGRMLRFFAKQGWSVVGIDIVAEMLSEARKFGLPHGAEVFLANGVVLPLHDRSVDMIWICGVLKYSLFAPGARCRGGSSPDEVTREPATRPSESFTPTYREIAREFYRVLKPGGRVVNVEMWVDAAPPAFTLDFELAGFTTERVRVLRRYLGFWERVCEWRDWHRLSPRLVVAAGQIGAALRYCIDNPRRKGVGLRDYLFVWYKPQASCARHQRRCP